MLPEAPGNRVGVVTAAGGYGVMCTDYIEQKDLRAGLRMAEFSGSTLRRIREINLPFASPHNPADITAVPTTSCMPKTSRRVWRMITVGPGLVLV